MGKMFPLIKRSLINPSDQSLCDQSPLVINFFEINCVAINPADAADRVAIDQRS